MKTISILNLKGGVGKTTTAINLAKGLANKGKKVLLIDTDMQANATSIFMEHKIIEKEFNSFSKLLMEYDRNNYMKYIYSVNDNLDMVGANLEVANAELRLRNEFERQTTHILQNYLEEIKENYDYCVIDCSPTINLITMNIIIASDEIIIPIKIDKFALQGYETTKQNVNKIISNFKLNVDVKVLFTMVNRNNIDKQIINNIEEKSFNTTIRFQAKPITEASMKNNVLIESDINTNVKKDYKEFIDEIMRGD